MKTTAILGSTLIALAAYSAPASAALVYGTPVDPGDYSGVRVYEDEGGSGQATIEWEVSQSGAFFTYRYTFHIPNISGPTFKDVSHFTLDLSDDFGDTDETDLRDSFSSNSPAGFDPQDPGDIEFGSFDGVLGGVKFDFGGGMPEDGVINTTDGLPLYYEFTIKRAPVWGNYAVKTGDGTFTNPGMGNEGTSMDTDDFIAAPNGMVPEPSALSLAGLGLLALAVCGWRRRR